MDVEFTTGIRLRIDEQDHGERVLRSVYEIVRGYPGTKNVELMLKMKDGTQVQTVSHKVKVEINKEMRSRLDELLGQGGVQYIVEVPKANGNGATENGNRWKRNAVNGNNR